jgi:hypothetical protein
MIRVICTGKETHQEIFMGSFDFGQLGGLRFHGGRDWPAYDDWREGPGEPLKKSYRFTCYQCGREARMKAHTLRTMFDGLRAAGKTTLDVSHLPF